MNTKQKIALHSLIQSVSRGIYSEEQAKAEFLKITGLDPDAEPAEDSKEYESLGKFFNSFGKALVEGIQAQQQQQKTAEEEDPRTVELNPPSDSLVKKRGKVVPDKKNPEKDLSQQE